MVKSKKFVRKNHYLPLLVFLLLFIPINIVFNLLISFLVDLYNIDKGCNGECFGGTAGALHAFVTLLIVPIIDVLISNELSKYHFNKIDRKNFNFKKSFFTIALLINLVIIVLNYELFFALLPGILISVGIIFLIFTIFSH